MVASVLHVACALPSEAHCIFVERRRLHSDMQIERATMVEGVSGFAVAQFGEEDPIETELPNLLLKSAVAPVRKRPALAVRDERPHGHPHGAAEPRAAVAGEGHPHGEGEPLAAAPASSLDGPALRRYQKMWYKHRHAFGIRQQFHAQKQIFQFRGKTEAVKPALEAIADEVIAKMERGELSEEAGKEWAQTRASEV